MYSILAAVALASLAAADLPKDLPVPRTECSATGSDGKVFTPATIGPIACAMAGAPGQAKTPNVAFTDQDCTPAFCYDGTLVNVCKGDNPPGAVAWSEIAKGIETSYQACSGVPRNSDGSFWLPHHKSWDAYVAFQPFTHYEKGWKVIVSGADCSQPGNSNVGDWDCEK